MGFGRRFRAKSLNLFKSKSKDEELSQPPSRKDSGYDANGEFMELPKDPGNNECPQLKELCKKLSKHELAEKTKEHGIPNLLGVPNEVRLKIVQYALPSGEDILITATGSANVPALLQTSRTLRKEASEVYYRTNTFTFEIKNFDASRLVAWMKPAPVKLRVFEPEKPCWENLVFWLMSYYEKGVLGMSFAEREEPECLRTARNMFRLVDKYRQAKREERPEWCVVREMEEGMRGVVWQLMG